MKTLFTTLGALGIFLWVFGLSMACYTLNNGDGFLFWKRKLIAKGRHAGETRTTWNWPGLRAFLWCVLGSAVPTAVWVFQRVLGEAFPWWGALICLVLMLALMVNIGIWWSRKTGVRWYEIIPHYLLIGQYTFIALAMAGIVAATIAASPFWASVVAIVPQLVSTYLGGYLLWSMFFCWSQETEAKHKTLWKVLGWIVVGLTTLSLTLTLILGLAWPTRSAKAEQPVETQVEPAPNPEPQATVWSWYHDAVLLDNYDEGGNLLTGEAYAEAILNDYNFGTDLVHDAVMRELNTGKISYSDIIACKSEEELVTKGLLSVDDVKAVYYERLGNDPTQLAAACLGWDVKFHTNHLGEFIVTLEEEHAEDAMELVNYAAAWWADRPEQFAIAAERFIEEMEHSNVIRLRYVPSGITDQMYMDGIWPGERPTIIVMESPNQYGWVIEFVKIIKGNEHVAGYCTTCGGQLYNVAKDLGVTPQANPNKATPKQGGGKPADTSGGGKPQATTGGGTPQATTGGGKPTTITGGGTPQITDPKDPAKGSDVPHQDVRPNDDPGITGDEFTYDPRDPWHSTAEKPMNSDNGMNVQEYFDLDEDAKEAEALPRRGDTPDNGSNYTPTYKPTPVEQSEGGVETHSNDDDGGKAGFGGIDVAAPVGTPATGNVVDNSGNVTQQTGGVAETVQPHWGVDMSR